MELLFPVKGPLSSSQIASILEAGLSYVLYQRGQIPLPYQQLQTSALQLKKLEESSKMYGASGAAGKGNLLVDVANQGENFMNQISDKSMGMEESSSEINPRERISTMLSERKKRLLMNKVEKRKRQAISMESKAYNSIQPAFEVLQKLLSDVCTINLGVTNSGQPKKILSAALVLGPSLYCPKEVYSFDLDFSWVSDDSSLILKVASEKFEKSVLRQFYKKIITDTDLMDFTCKPLAKTYAHICLVTLGDLNSILHGDSYYKDVTRLPTLPPALLEMTNSQFMDAESMEVDPSVSAKPYAFGNSRKTRKCFKFKIQYDKFTVVDQNRINLAQIFSTNNKSDSFSGDILFDNNSFSCYQIPLRFKGVQCKNKRL